MSKIIDGGKANLVTGRDPGDRFVSETETVTIECQNIDASATGAPSNGILFNYGVGVVSGLTPLATTQPYGPVPPYGFWVHVDSPDYNRTYEDAFPGVTTTGGEFSAHLTDPERIITQLTCVLIRPSANMMYWSGIPFSGSSYDDSFHGVEDWAFRLITNMNGSVIGTYASSGVTIDGTYTGSGSGSRDGVSWTYENDTGSRGLPIPAPGMFPPTGHDYDNADTYTRITIDIGVGGTHGPGTPGLYISNRWAYANAADDPLFSDVFFTEMHACGPVSTTTGAPRGQMQMRPGDTRAGFDPAKVTHA